MKIRIFFGAFFSLLLLPVSDMFAQNACSQNLLTAQRRYDQGQLQEVEDLLLPCIENGFNRAERIQAYRLVMLADLFKDETEKASELMKKLLKQEPNYTPNRAIDPSEFLTLFDSYRAVPVFSIGIRGGLNNTRVRILNEYSLSTTQNNNSVYSNIPSLSLGLTTSTALYRNLHLSLDILYAARSYSLNDPYLDFIVTYEERQNYLELPLGITYIHGKGKTRPFVQAGVATAFLLDANALVQRNQADGTREAVGPEFSVADLRNALQASAFGSIGVRRKLGKSEVFAEARYYYALNVSNNPDERLSNQDLLYRYGHIDSDFTLNNVMFSVGFLQNFYAVRENKIRNDR